MALGADTSTRGIRTPGPEVDLLFPLLRRRRGGLRLGERARHGAGRRGELLLVGLGLLGLAAGPLLALRHHDSPVGLLSRTAHCRLATGAPPFGTAQRPSRTRSSRTGYGGPRPTPERARAFLIGGSGEHAGNRQCRPRHHLSSTSLTACRACRGRARRSWPPPAASAARD